MRGSPTLSATAAAGATTLQIANAFGANLLKYTQQFDNAYWSKNGASITADATTAPDGTSTADKLVESAANADHNIERRTIAGDTGAAHTWSVYAKAAERSAIRVQLFGANTANSIYANANLSSGVISSSGASGAGVLQSAAISNVGDGWYRISVSGRVEPVDGGDFYAVRVAIINPSTVYLGDGTSGVYIWGAQFEQGSAASAYDPYATLKAGDMIGAGGQLVQVVADATAGADAVITASIRPALRAQVAAGSAVLWDKPTATFILTSPEVRVGYRPALGEEIALDFMEVFA